MNDTIRFIPEAASKSAVEVDYLSLALLGICVFFSVGISVAIIAFGFRFWHTRDVNREFNPSTMMHWAVELTWTLGPLTILLIMFAWGAVVYINAHQPPKNPLEVNVVAKQWMWKISHPSGRREINALHVPTGRPVRLTMISEDVIHSFYVPAFRAKQDVLPGRFSTFWFEATKPGIYHLFCAEYCGTSHSKMVGKVVVQSPENYAEWISAKHEDTIAERGRRSVEALGCMKCHDFVAGKQTGPSLIDLYGSTVMLSDGSSVIADDDYIRRSIFEPMAQVRTGFKPIMPSYEGKIEPDAMLEIIAYLRGAR